MEHPLVVVAGGGDGRSFWGPGDTYTFLVTGEQSGGSMFAMDCLLGPGGGPPPHRHLAEDELFYVYSGAVEFTVDGNTAMIATGRSAFIPRGTAHSYVNATEDPARMLAISRRLAWRAGSWRSAPLSATRAWRRRR